jgi:hypothetical protein
MTPSNLPATVLGAGDPEEVYQILKLSTDFKTQLQDLIYILLFTIVFQSRVQVIDFWVLQ